LQKGWSGDIFGVTAKTGGSMDWRNHVHADRESEYMGKVSGKGSNL
jgi:hypothetical protein